MWRARDRLGALEAAVLLVSFEPRETIRRVSARWAHGWPVASDPERTAYRSYGLSRGGFRRIWLSRRTVAYYARALLRGRVPRRLSGDLRQLGGDFVIDGDGTLLGAWPGSEPADRPPVEEILDVLERAAAP